MFDDVLIVLFVLVLAALVGAGLGSYLAMRPAAERVLQRAEELSAQAQSALESVQQSIERGVEELGNLTIEVPEPKVTMNVNAAPSPWSALLLALGFVGGMALLRMKQTQRLIRNVDHGMDQAITSIRRRLITARRGLGKQPRARRKGARHGQEAKTKEARRTSKD